MPATILSDNGVSSGSAGIKTSGSNDGTLALQTTTAGGTATTALTINTTQAIGVGSSPSYGTSGQFLTSGGSTASPTWTTAASSQWTTSGSNIYYSTGNVSVGTSSNTANLDVRGTNQATVDGYIGGNLNISTTNTATVGYGGTLTFGGNYTGTSYAGFASIAGRLSATGSSTGYMTFGTTVGGTGTLERGRFNASGYFKATNADYPDGADTQYHYFNSNISAGGSDDRVVAIRADSGSFAGYGILRVYSTRTTTNGTFRICAFTNGNGSGACYIADSGNVTNTNNSYGSSSDVKLKENIVDTTPKLEKLMRLRVRNYNLKTKPDEPHIGLIAQETETVFPGLIEESIDYHDIQTTDENGKEVTKNVPTGTTTKAIKYSVFVPMLIKAMQEQQELITAQAATITALTARIVALENK
jgi:hypothetical protein